MVFRKPCQEIQQLTAQDVEEQNQLEKLENMFYIPQDFTSGSDTPDDSSLTKLLDNLDRDIVVSDFHELPSLDFWPVFFFDRTNLTCDMGFSKYIKKEDSKI